MPPADGIELDFTGYTPLDLAVMARRDGPGSRVREGSRDIKLWEEMMDDIIELLYKKGGEPSSVALPAVQFWPAIRTGQLLNLFILDDLSTIFKPAELPPLTPFPKQPPLTIFFSRSSRYG